MRTAMLKTKLIEVCYPNGIHPSEFDRFENYVRPALENLLRALGRDTSIQKVLEPEESAALTARIVELHAIHGPAWLAISRALAQEGKICNRDAVRKRFQEHVKQLKAKAAATVVQNSGEENVSPVLQREGNVAEIRPDEQVAAPTAAALQSAAEVESAVAQEVTGPVRTGPEKASDSDETLRNVADSQPPQPKAAQVQASAAALQGEAEPAEKASNPEENQSEETVTDTSPRSTSQFETEITKSIEAEILRLRATGMDTRKISNELAKRDIFVSWQRIRSHLINVKKRENKKLQPEAPQKDNSLGSEETGSTPAPGSQPQQNVNLLGSEMAGFQPSFLQESQQDVKPIAEEKAEPKSINRVELDLLIWDMWRKEGLTPAEISDRLCAEGYYYGERSVRTKLLAQGAKL